MIRRIALALSLLPILLLVVPRSSSAALSLALQRSDYPQGAQIAAYPSTNALADRLLGPVHRSRFAALHRVNGQGWLQAAQWHFRTGSGAAQSNHLTLFGYGINVFRSAQQASRALGDLKIKTRVYRVAHLPALLYQSSDARETLAFVFFVYKNIEIEAYYEYMGTAPTAMANSLHHIFSRQSSHLAHLARVLYQATHQPTLTPTPSPTSTTVPTATLTPTSTPTATSTATPRPTARPLPPPPALPSPTATPVTLVAQASMTSSIYPPSAAATLKIRVTLGGQPVSGASVVATFNFPGRTATCVTTTDQNGAASCNELVPPEPDGTQVFVSVEVAASNGQETSASASFSIQRTS